MADPNTDQVLTPDQTKALLAEASTVIADVTKIAADLQDVAGKVAGLVASLKALRALFP